MHRTRVLRHGARYGPPVRALPLGSLLLARVPLGGLEGAQARVLRLARPLGHSACAAQTALACLIRENFGPSGPMSKAFGLDARAQAPHGSSLPSNGPPLGRPAISAVVQWPRRFTAVLTHRRSAALSSAQQRWLSIIAEAATGAALARPLRC